MVNHNDLASGTRATRYSAYLAPYVQSHVSQCSRASSHRLCKCFTAYNAGVQGLHANVAVLDAELVGIDREQQSISLSNGQKVLYGMLVIAAGLDQASSKDIAGQFEGPFTNVISLKSAVKLSTEVCLLLQLLTCICLYVTQILQLPSA